MTVSKVKEQKKNPNIKTFKKIENWGLLITLMGIVIKLFVFDTYAEKMATTDRYMESYQKKELTSHINEIKAMLSPSYVSTERDYRILAEIMLHATQYFLIALDINEGSRIIKNLQAEGNMVTNNESYTAFKSKCYDVIEKYKYKVYSQFERNKSILDISGWIVGIITILGTLMMVIAKGKLINME